MLKNHQETIKQRNETQEKLKKETVDAANELTVNLVSFSYKFSSLCGKHLKICCSRSIS
jgi:glutamate/tyrosine decarboxylase-like PLP-dependent enzyme